MRFTDSILRLLEATEALTASQRLVTEAEFYGRRFASGVVDPRAARAGLPGHRADVVSGCGRAHRRQRGDRRGRELRADEPPHSASASSRDRAAE